MSATTFTLHANHPGRATVLSNAITFIAGLPCDKPWDISIERHVKERSDKQRAALFAVAYKALMDHAGLQGDDDKKQLHWFMCGEFFGWRDLPIGRKPLRTTTKNEFGERDVISVTQQLEMYAFIQQRGAEVGCFVPDPDPFWREKAEQEQRE